MSAPERSKFKIRDGFVVCTQEPTLAGETSLVIDKIVAIEIVRWNTSLTAIHMQGGTVFTVIGMPHEIEAEIAKYKGWDKYAG